MRKKELFELTIYIRLVHECTFTVNRWRNTFVFYTQSNCSLIAMYVLFLCKVKPKTANISLKTNTELFNGGSKRELNIILL